MRVGGQQARCTRRKKKLWLVDSLLPSQPPLSAYRALLLPSASATCKFKAMKDFIVIVDVGHSRQVFG